MSRVRTVVVALLVGIVAIRVSLLLPVSAVTRRIAVDPAEALRSAGDVWTATGSLGGPSAQLLRELPYASAVWLGSEAGLSATAVEAVWRAGVLLLAVLGAVRLARGLAVGTGDQRGERAPDEPWTAWTGAVLFALGTVMVPTVLRSPTDGLAAATLPWVVAPLLVRSPGWRPGLASALWVGVAGFGTPMWALAVFVAGMVAALPRRRSGVAGLVRWFVLASAASAWWIALLLWESAHVPDVSALARDGLRDSVAEAISRSDLPFVVLLVVTTWPLLVAVAAVVLRSPGLRLRFVLALLAASLVVVIVDEAGRVPVAAPLGGQDPADVAGPVLGWLGLLALVAWCPLLADLGARRRPTDPGRGAGRRPAALAVGALLGVTAFAGVAASVTDPEPALAADPTLLDEVAEWSARARPGRVLVLPPETGRTGVASLGAALGPRPWVGRDAVPGSGPAGTAALDDLIGRLGRGEGGPGTLSALRRLGISFVLVRLGGPTEEDRTGPLALVRSALSAAGAARVAVLRGAGDGGFDAEGDPLQDAGIRSRTDQIEIWAPPSTGHGWVYQGSPVEVVGDAGSVGDLADAGVLGDRAVRLRPPSQEEAVVLSDSARRRDVDQRVPVDPYGPDLDAHAPRSVLPAAAAPVTTAWRQAIGAASVTASSSTADLDGSLRRAGTDATAAVDGNTFTAWQTRRGTGVGEWWQVRFHGRTNLDGASIQFQRNVLNEFAVAEVRVEADDRSLTRLVPHDGVLHLDDLGDSTRLRVTVTAVSGDFGSDDSVGIIEVSIPGRPVTTRLQIGEAPTESWLMASRTGNRARCAPAVPRGGKDADGLPGTACNAALSVGGSDAPGLDRTVTASERTDVVGRAWVVAAATRSAGALADRIARPSVIATSGSVATSDLVARPQAAADADPSTAWWPAPSDRNPELTLSWPDPAEISGLRLLPPTGHLGSRPTRVQVTAEAAAQEAGAVPPPPVEAEVAPDGTITMPPVLTNRLTVRVLDDTDVPTADSLTGTVGRMPVAVGEVELIGGPAVTYDGTRVERIGCGAGPSLTIGGVAHGTRLTANATQIVQGRPIRASVCGRPALPSGRSTVTMPGTFEWHPRGLLLAAASGSLAEAGSVATGGDDPVRVRTGVLGRAGHGDALVADVGEDQGSARTLVLAVPAGSGWQASVGGERLVPVTVDGWAQGWVVPEGWDQVTLRYSTGSDVVLVVFGGVAAWVLGLLLLGALGLRSAVAARRASRYPA